MGTIHAGSPFQITGGGAVSNKFVTVITGAGAVTLAQPAATNLSDYATTTWSPTATGLTQTGGSATITGHYTQIGNLVFFSIDITPVTSTAATANSTYISLPSVPARTTACGAVDSAVTSLGNGLALAGLARCYTPTWGTNTNQILISGCYELA